MILGPRWRKLAGITSFRLRWSLRNNIPHISTDYALNLAIICDELVHLVAPDMYVVALWLTRAGRPQQRYLSPVSARGEGANCIRQQ